MIIGHTRRATIRAVWLGLVLALTPLPAAAQDRWALVVGIAEYESDEIEDLDNTVNDARTMAASLNNMGFRVYLLENTTRDELNDAVIQIGQDLPDAELGLFFFAGHGLQADGANYALPADMQVTGPDFLKDQGISIGDVMGRMAGLGVERLVVILDACRNSPFDDPDQVFGTGLALIDAPQNTIIAYSTAPGAVALDGTGANSPYTAALASSLEGPQQDLRDVLRFVRAQVRLATGGLQTPWYIDNSRAEMIIQPRDPVPLPEDAERRLGEGVSLVSTAWRTIASSSDPRDFELFAELHAEDALAEVALRQVSLLRDGQRAPLPPMDLGVPDPNPAVPDGLGAMITECDVLATGPGDLLAIVDPVPHNLVNTRAALRACIAAVTNDPQNPRLLGHLARVLRLEQRFEESLFYYEQAANLGSAAAYGGLSDIHRLGLGVPENKELSAAYARRAALMGNAPMRLVLGMHYREGWGVPQSFSEARRWMELAALTGDVGAITALGDLYRRGQGMPADPARAIDYYRQAAALGKTDAMNNIGISYMRGEGVPVDHAQGVWWLSRATDEGNPYAPFHLGRMFLTAWGVEADPRQALAYFRLSAQRNFLGAYIFIGDVLQSDDLGEPDLPEAMANYIIAIEAARIRDTIAAQTELEQAETKLADLTARMTADQVADGARIAAEWIDQYGLLDFNLLNQ